MNNLSEVKAAALAWRGAGFSVVRIKRDWTKSPVGEWKQYVKQAASVERVERWFDDEQWGLGVIMGAVSGGAEMLEVEGRAENHLNDLAELAHASGLGPLWDRVWIPNGYVEMSPGGGYHIIYRVEGAEIAGNTKLAVREDKLVLAETRGEGGQVVVAPTPGTHHETNIPWTLICGSPGVVPVITVDEQEALHNLFRTIDERPALIKDTKKSSGSRREGRPGDDFENATSWESILEPHGWTLVFEAQGTKYWRRPGKAIGTSATTGHAADRDRLFVFTTSTGFEAETPYTKFGAYAVLNHDGNHSHASGDLRAQGFGSAPRDDMHTGGRGKDGRVRVHIGDQSAATEWLRQEMGKGELSGLFMRSGQLVHTPCIGEDGYIEPVRRECDPDGLLHDGPSQVRLVTQDGLIAMLEVRYDVGTVKESKGKDKNTDPEIDVDAESTPVDADKVRRWKPALMPKSIATRMIGAASMGEGVPNLKPLNAVSHTPTIRRDGSLFNEPGYDLSSGTLFLPTGDAGDISVPDRPTVMQVKAAVETVMYPISQFPFVSDDAMANWIGCAFTPLMRSLVPPPYQFGVIEAPSPGSGKGFLLGILREIHGVAVRPGMPSREEEWSKLVATLLSNTTSPIIAFDNVRGVVRSTVLEALLTSTVISDRTLGSNTAALNLLNDRLWMMTGNNASIGGDLARRTLRITIDPQMENPESRTNFRCNPVKWASENRAKYISALLTIMRYWVNAGKPVRPVERSDDYANWVQTVRGIMELAGFPGEFSHTDKKSELSEEDDEWARFLAAIVDCIGGELFTARELHALIGRDDLGGHQSAISPDLLPGELVDKYGSFGHDARFVKSLGYWLKNRIGRYAGGLVVVDCGKGYEGTRKNVATYRIGAPSRQTTQPAAPREYEQVSFS